MARIDENVATIRMYEYESEYEQKLRWLRKYAEGWRVHKPYVECEGAMWIVPPEVAVAFKKKWPETA